MATAKGVNHNENDVLDAIANLSNATTGDKQTMATLTATNATLSKQIINMNAKLVVAL